MNAGLDADRTLQPRDARRSNPWEIARDLMSGREFSAGLVVIVIATTAAGFLNYLDSALVAYVTRILVGAWILALAVTAIDQHVHHTRRFRYVTVVTACGTYGVTVALKTTLPGWAASFGGALTAVAAVGAIVGIRWVGRYQVPDERDS